MVDLVAKLLIVMFALAIGGCFLFWPEGVSRRFDRWRGQGAESTRDQWANIRGRYRMIWFRQIGVFLISLTCYAIYLWVRAG